MVRTDDTEFLTIAEVSNLLRVSRVTLHRWLKQGRLQAYHVGPRAVRIRREDLDTVVTSLRPTEMAVASDGNVEQTQTHIRPLSEEERQRGLEALKESGQLIQEMRAKRGGQPLDESWPMIREAREKRSGERCAMGTERPIYQGRIVSDPNILVGKPAIKGTRIAVEHVLEQFADSPDIAELLEVYPDLTPEDVQACLAYAQALVAGESVDPAPGPQRSRRTAARSRV